MTIEENMLAQLKLKPKNQGIVAFIQEFAEKNDMKPGKAHTIYYNSVRTDFEKWEQAQSYWSGKEKAKVKEAAKEKPKSEPPKKISQYDIAKAAKFGTPLPGQEPPKDKTTLKMRIALLEMLKLQDPIHQLVLEPWLEELKEVVR